MNLSLKQLQYLCTLADTQNYHTAAQQLYLTQPALSMAIKNLEKALGAPLFMRNTKEVQPTETGRIAIAYARKILSLEQKMEQELRKASSQKLRVGTYFSLYSLYMPDFLKAIHSLHPQLNLTTLHETYAALKQDLVLHKLDLIFCVQDKPSPLFDSIPLKKEHLLVALAPDHPACAKAKILPHLPYPYLDIRELKQETFLIQYPNQQIRWQEEKLWNKNGAEPREKKEIDSIDLSVRLASEGLGAAFTMESYVPALRPLKPVRYFVTGDIQDCPWLSICVPKGHARRPLIKDCIQLLKKQVEKMETEEKKRS